ncbi:DEKNAAC104422 [Brettanomyces naardenensis]|uniref:DEKNAAC104422 n=1 Tax=Brettanomyces naardenensis TaxID=13370 RepID=A0A448YQY7_BRENA|nr:DEKNAAC104422 [Brettanomyces naardenensis]
MSSEKLNNISLDLPADNRRIHYAEDVGEDRTPGVGLRRSMSAYSIRSSRSIEPELALPVTYRTVSIDLDEEAQSRAAKAKHKLDKNAAEIADLDYHLISMDEICKRFGVTLGEGITSAEATKRLSEYGKNVPSPPPRHIFRQILEYLFGGFGSILLIGAVLVFISWKPLGQPPSQANLGLAIVLVAVFVIQSVFNAWQDWSSSRVMKSIMNVLPEECHVLRDGSKVSVPAPEVVPGDTLFFKAGNKLPADIRFMEVSTDAKFDRSILTGESLPVSARIVPRESNYLEARCIGMQGTYCTSGSGTGIVVSTGDSTVFGRIARMTNAPANEQTPLQKEIQRFVFIIISLMLSMDIIIIGVWAGYIRKKHPTYMPVDTFIVDLVSIAVAFIPEGLPISLTATLTITAGIMKKNNILCKSLKTVETLGAVSVLLSDKTGTLTKNQMVVTDVAVGSSAMSSDDAADSKDKRTALTQLKIVGAVCNAGEFDPTTTGLPLAQQKIIADATDAAVLRFSASLGPIEESRGLWKKVFDLTFNSKNKFAIRVSSATSEESLQASLAASEVRNFSRGEDLYLAIKGAPDVLLPRCSSVVGEDGEVHPLTQERQTCIDEIKDKWSAQGKRVLLLARKTIYPGDIKSDPTDGEYERELVRFSGADLIVCGLVGIVDPTRPEVPEVIRILRGAGVRTMMVTGDFKLTAQAIAMDCGIITCHPSQVDSYENLPRLSGKATAAPMNGSSIVISGPEIIRLNESQWDALCNYEEVVFARTTPEQKLRIVKEFKARGNMVAMTGDGVNDAPSLKAADIGIAPGTGSDIAIEAADMVLLDSFSAIVEALRYGRLVYDNLKKIICYILPAGQFAEFWPVMTSVIFGLPQVLSSFLMIIICCLTDCGTAIALAYEKPEANLLLRPPRNVKKDRLVDWRLMLHSYLLPGIIETVCSFAMSYWWLDSHNFKFSVLWWSFGDYSGAPSDVQNNSVSLLNKASAIYFVNLVVMQWFNAMATRTRYLSVFTHPPFFNRATQNWRLLPAIVFALVMAFIFCYIPGLQPVASSSTVPVAHWFLPMAFGLALLSVDELRKAAVRRWPRGILSKTAW